MSKKRVKTYRYSQTRRWVYHPPLTPEDHSSAQLQSKNATDDATGNRVKGRPKFGVIIRRKYEGVLRSGCEKSVLDRRECGGNG